MKKLVLLLLFIPLVTFGQNFYSFEVYDELSVYLPGDVYYTDQKDDNGNLIYEELFNDDFELVLSVYEKDAFDYFSDLTLFIDEVVDQMEFQKHSEYYKKNYSDGLSGLFHITYSKDSDSNVIFGVIQDSFSKKLYEIDLTCLNIGSKTARKIIESITIDN